MAALVHDQLVQRLQAKQRSLLVPITLALEEWHDQGPEEHLDDP